MFPTKKEQQDRHGNGKAGLCADRGICNEEKMQFRLQPHCAVQGMPKMLCYTVLHNEPALSMEQLVKFTFQVTTSANQLGC